MSDWPAHDDCRDECWFAPTLRAMSKDLDATIKQRDELQAEVDRLTAALERTEANRDVILSDLAEVTAERDQALAQAAAAAVEMRERAAEHAWDKRDLLADAEKKQIDAGLTGRDYYGRRLEAELLSRSIRALPINPDAQQALDKLLAKAREDAIMEAADIVSKNRYISGWVSHDAILALLTDGGRDE